MSTSNLNQKLSVVLVLVLISATLFAQLPGIVAVSAQSQPGDFWQVRSIETRDFGIPHPIGLAFSPAANAFLVLQAWQPGRPTALGTYITMITLGEDPGGLVNLATAIRDPSNMAFDSRGNRLAALDITANELIEISIGPNGVPESSASAMTRRDIRHFGLQSAQGITFDPKSGDLFILDGAASRMVRVTPDGRINSVNLNRPDHAALRGIAYNPGNNHLYVLNAVQDRVYELTTDGQLISTLNLAELGLSDPRAMLFAPSGDSTDDTSIMDLFILDSGRSMAPGAASPSGQIVELSLQPAASLPAGTTLLPTTLVKIVDTSKAAWNPSSPDPAGVDYWPMTGRLLISDSEVDEMPNYFTGKNVYAATLSGALVSTCSTTNLNRTGFSNEPTGVAIDPIHNRVYFSDDSAKKVFEVSLGPDGIYCTADDVVTSVAFSTDTEDVAYGNNRLYIASGIDAEVYVYDLGPNGFLGGGDDSLVTHWDTAILGFNDLEGIGY